MAKGDVARTGRTRAADLADGLRDQILTGALTVGMKLPSENELTATYDVSRSVVREALQQLQAGGLVESFQGRGTYVLDLPGQEPDGGAFRAVSRDDAAALLEYRMGVEGEAAALAATRRTDLQLVAIERALPFEEGSCVAADDDGAVRIGPWTSGVESSADAYQVFRFIR